MSFYIFDQTCIVLKSGWNSTARMPRLVRRADALFLPPPCHASSFIPFLVRSLCLASSFLPCVSSFALPRFHRPFPPHRPPSIYPLYPGASGRVAKQAARMSSSFLFKYKMLPRLVQSVCQPLLRKCSNEGTPEKLFFTRLKHQTTETIRLKEKSMWSSPVFAHPRQVSARLATTLPKFVFQLPKTKAHKFP